MPSNVRHSLLLNTLVLCVALTSLSPTANTAGISAPELTARQRITPVNIPEKRNSVRTALTELKGITQLTQNVGPLTPVAMASGDFDEDGIPDLVVGFSAGVDGLPTLYRGNADSIYPNTEQASRRRNRGEAIDAPFLPGTESLVLPAAIDFLGTGDFDNDGHLDVVSGSHDQNQLHFILGNGRGRFGETKQLTLPGSPTQLITGEINRPDGIADLVVGIETEQSPAVLVFESPDGVLHAKPERYPVPFPVNALALAQITSNFKDLVVASGNHLLIVNGRDRKLSFDLARQRWVDPATVENRSFAFKIESLAVGDFSGRQQRELALLLEDGSIHTLSPITKKEESARLRLLPAIEQLELSIRGWHSREVQSSTSKPHSKKTFLVNGGRSLLYSDSLVVAEKGSGQMDVVDLAENGGSGSFELLSWTQSPTPRSTSLEVSGEVNDVMPMRLNGDALSDLVILKSGEHPLSILATQPESVFTVTNTNDSGAGSLRQAIIDANNNPGLDTISFSITGGGIKTILPLSFFPDITGAVTIDGTTQPGFAGIPLIEIAGYKAGDSNGLTLSGGNSTVRGLTINHFFQLAGTNRGYQIRIEVGTSSNNRIEGNLINTDNLGTGPAPNPNNFLNSGIHLNSPDSTIGGTAPAARNVISGNKQIGIELQGSVAARTIIQGNFIGPDITGTVAIGNGFRGISVQGAPNTVIGGTSPGAGNIISKNAPFGIIVDSDNNIIQGNFIGTDVTGTVAIPNFLSGIALGAVVNNTVGGTSPNARNVISGHLHDGIMISASGRTGFQIQGNYIGTDVSGTIAMSNRENGINMGNTEDSLVAGNLVSGNVGYGIHLFGIGIPASRNTQIRNNRIGTDASGTGALGNIGLGVYVDGTGGVLIGGLDGNGANTIAFNTRGGVYIGLAWDDAIRQNSIFSNGGLGIDLAPLECNYLLGCYGNVTPNDACDTDNGGDRLQNFPVVAAAGSSVLGTRIQGTLNSAANTTFVLDFFSNDSCAPSGYGEGKTFIGSTTVTTDSVCVASFNVLLATFVPEGKIVTSTATDPSGNTSEFSQCVGVVGLPPPPTVQFTRRPIQLARLVRA